MVLPLYVVMVRIDPNLAKAANTLGATPVSSFFRVYLPLSLPGVIAGSLLCFVMCLGYYVTPAMVGGRGDLMIGQLIVVQIGNFGNWGMAGALSLILLVSTALVFALLGVATRRSRRWAPR
jgi:putative spermidine/putrescine transport system permease protein